MENINDLIRECVYNTPYILLSLSKEHLEIANSYLPYSTGFEIECFKKETFNEEAFRKIPDIMEINCDVGEQRFRIPNGVRGLICLYNISQELKRNSELNEGSGIHYHIDMTDFTDFWENNGEPYIENHADYILTELDKWNYQGNYNLRVLNYSTSHNWMRFPTDFKTAEIRIGEMTFDYKLLVERITHANSIIKTLKEEETLCPFIPLTNVDKQILLEYYKNTSNGKKDSNKMSNLLKQYKEFLEEDDKGQVVDLEQIKQNIKKREIKWTPTTKHQ